MEMKACGEDVFDCLSSELSHQLLSFEGELSSNNDAEGFVDTSLPIQPLRCILLLGI